MTSPKSLECGTNRDLLIAETPDQIQLYRLISAKCALRLERSGLRHSRLGKNGVKRLWARHWNLSSRCSFDDVLARFDQEINLLKEKIRGQTPHNPE